MGEVGEILGMDTTAVAEGVYEIASTAMGDLVSTTTIGRGYDPKDFVLFVYGGAGGLFGARYSREIECQKAVVVPNPETFSAFGISITDIKHVYEQTSPTPSFDIDVINRFFEQSGNTARQQLRRENVAEAEMILIHSIGLKYRAQIHELLINVPSRKLTGEDVPMIADRFDSSYEAVFGKGAAYKQAGRDLMTLRLEAIGRLPQFPFLKHAAGDGDAGRALRGRRRAYWKDAGGFVSTDIFDGPKLLAGDTLSGPAIIAMPNTTVLVPPKTTARMGHYREIYLQGSGDV